MAGGQFVHIIIHNLPQAYAGGFQGVLPKACGDRCAGRAAYGARYRVIIGE
jgi:hypothetical protein